MEKPPLVHKKIGPRLLHVSRDCLRRTYSLALAWRWTGEKKYADKAVENLLTVCAFKDWNPSHFQAAAGKAAILKFEAAKVVIDFTSAYKKAVSKATRGLKLVCGRMAVLVQDEFELTGTKGSEITWAMTTDAKIAIKSKTLAELTLDGRKLVARILSPTGAEFAVESAEQKPPQKPNKGVSRLLARVKGAKGTVRMAILLAPAWKGFTPPAAMQLTPLGKW